MNQTAGPLVLQGDARLASSPRRRRHTPVPKGMAQMTISRARSGSTFSWLRGKRSKLALAAVSAYALALTMGSAGSASADQNAQLHSIFVYPTGGAPIACLDILGGSAANGTPVQAYDKCHFDGSVTASQTWTEITVSSTIRSAVSGKCLDIVGGGKAHAAPRWTCTPATALAPRSGYAMPTIPCTTPSPASASTSRAALLGSRYRSGTAPTPPTSFGCSVLVNDLG